MRGFRCPSRDSYGWARLCQVIGNFFGGSLSVGIDRFRNSDTKAGDNGLYVIQNWEIVERVGSHCPGEGHDRAELLLNIDKSQPESEQLGEDFFNSQETEVSKLKIGDEVLICSIKSLYERHSIVGIGDGRYCNGQNTLGLPYIDLFGNDSPENNCNNYIKSKTIRSITN